ncbi:small RNA binding protein 1-like [Impatiens glandulifera]|uniref:small RNA binding protein 1-like n=1 Tax=Impatiens glandulifera TaxID=253017 RepID=UPI001FB05E36|nr:small RNA binding protein 1-like [Impatiens glandulifera]
MKINTYENNIVNNTYSKFEKNFFKRQSERSECEKEFNMDLHQEVMDGMNLVQENAEAATEKEKNLIALDADNVKKGEGSSRGGGSSSLRGGGYRPTKRGGGRGGDRGGRSGGRGGSAPSGGRALHQFHNLLSSEEFSYPNVKREEQ